MVQSDVEKWEAELRSFEALSIPKKIAAMVKAFKRVKWPKGMDWASPKVCAAVDKLQSSVGIKKLDMIAKEIGKMEGTTDAKWLQAFKFSQSLESMVSTATEYGCDLVNGSEGEWCVEVVDVIKGMWRDIIGDGSVLPSKKVEAKVCDGMAYSFGDYWYMEDNLDAVIAKAKSEAAKNTENEAPIPAAKCAKTVSA